MNDCRYIVSSKSFKPLKDLLGQAKNEITRALHEQICGGEKVEQFVMSPHMALEVEKLTQQLVKKKEDIEKLLPKAIPPFPRVCVEMPITEDIEQLRPAGLKENTSKIVRVGALIESLPDKDEEGKFIYSFSPYYEFANGIFGEDPKIYGEVVCSHVTLYHKSDQLIPNLFPIQFVDLGMVWNGMFSTAFGKTMIKQGVTPEKLINEKTREAFKQVVVESAEEIPNLFVAWLILLNSKSGVTKTKVREIYPNTKLGKRERNRRSRSAYTVVSLTDTENVDADSGVVTEKHIIGAHRVRGHFKAKKWGVFWWRPHVRGVGEVKYREAYKLTASMA
jgi:hypothetical protein